MLVARGGPQAMVDWCEQDRGLVGWEWTEQDRDRCPYRFKAFQDALKTEVRRWVVAIPHCEHRLACRSVRP